MWYPDRHPLSKPSPSREVWTLAGGSNTNWFVGLGETSSCVHYLLWINQSMLFRGSSMKWLSNSRIQGNQPITAHYFPWINQSIREQLILICCFPKYQSTLLRWSSMNWLVNPRKAINQCTLLSMKQPINTASSKQYELIGSLEAVNQYVMLPMNQPNNISSWKQYELIG